MAGVLRLFRQLVVVTIIAWGLVALAFQAAPLLLAPFKGDIEHWLSARLNNDVRVGGISTRLDGWAPRVQLHDVTVGDELQLRHIALDVTLSDLARRPVTDALRLTLDGLSLKVIREHNGQLHVSGLPGMQDGDSGDGPVLLPGNLRLTGTQLIWEDRRNRLPALTIQPLSLDVRRDGSSVDVRASMTGPGGGEAKLAARFEGFLSTTDWSGDTYISVHDVDIAALLTPYLPQDYRLNSLTADFEAWQHWYQARPTSSVGSIALQQLDFSGRGELQIEQMTSRFNIQHHDDNWLVALDGFELRRGGRDWPAGRIVADIQHDTTGLDVQAAADFMRIEDVLAVLQVRLPWTELEEPLAQLQPRGDIADLRLRLHFAPDDFSMDARLDFNDLAVNSAPDTPGIRGLSGQLVATAERLSVRLSSEDLVLDYPRLFRKPLQIQQAAGQLQWEQTDSGWVLHSPAIDIVSPILTTRTRLAMYRDADRPLYLDLQSDFRDGDARFASDMYPARIMGKELVQWLDSAISNGRVTSGSALVAGPLDTFPYHRMRNGAFEVVADTQDVDLAYQAGWPLLKQVSATLDFHENSMQILLKQGAIYDSPVTSAEATIASLDPTSPIRVKGRLGGALADKIRVLGEDALKKDFGTFAAGLKASGDADLALDFTVPLKSGQGEYRLDGKLDFRNSTLALPEWDLEIEDIRGQLEISLDALRASDLRGRALGSDIRVDVQPLKNGTTRIGAKGRLGIDAVARQLPQLPLQSMQGDALFRIDVDIPGVSAGANATTTLSVTSDLKGMTVDLPAPLGKTPNARRPLVFRMPVAGKPMPIKVTYNNDIAASIAPDWNRAVLRFGDGDLVMPDAGYRVRGRVDRFDLAAWRSALDTLAGGTKRDTTLPPIDLKLQFGRFELGATPLNDLLLLLSHHEDRWQGTLRNDVIEGRFDFAADKETPTLQADLKRLHLRFAESGDTAPAAPAADHDTDTAGDPRAIPKLVLRCDDVRINDARLGVLYIDAEPMTDGMRIGELRLRDGQALLDASGSWTKPRGKAPRTSLRGTASSDDIGRLLKKLGYARQFEDADADAEFALDWRGNPFQPVTRTLAGSLDIRIGRGRLAEVEPGVSRVIGLLNFSALTRRLRLDFSDLFKKGFSFDSIEGTFLLDQGQAYSNNVTLQGPSGRIDVSGRVGLPEEDFDQLVVVTPKLDATLPLAGTLAGGPVAGLAVLIAQTIMKDEVDAINRFEYSITGSWEDPQVRQLDSGGALSKLLKPFSQEKKSGDNDSTEPEVAPDTAPAPPAAEGDSEPQANLLIRWLENLSPTGSGEEYLE